jgi:hypothetical protein
VHAVHAAPRPAPAPARRAPSIEPAIRLRRMAARRAHAARLLLALLAVAVLLPAAASAEDAEDAEDADADAFPTPAPDALAAAPGAAPAPAPAAAAPLLAPADPAAAPLLGASALAGGAGGAGAPPPAEGAILMTLRQSSSNWDEVAASRGIVGWNWPATEPCEGWSGVACVGAGADGALAVTRVELPGLGLRGSLPPELTRLPALEVLNLRGSSFGGVLPAQWSSPTLQLLDVSGNELESALPESWGGAGAFPALREVHLADNRLFGPLPPSWGPGIGAGAAVVLRPGNVALCGDVAPPAAAPEATAYLWRGLFLGMLAAGTPTAPAVALTNTLGACTTACGRTAAMRDNLLDTAAAAGVTVADLVWANFELIDRGRLEPGTPLAVPCYAPDPPAAAALGSDVAVGQFAGGNDPPRAGGGAPAAAAAVVAAPGAAPVAPAFYNGSTVWLDPTRPAVSAAVAAAAGAWLADAGGASGGAAGGLSAGGTELVRARVQPVYWFVDVGGPLTVSAVTVVAGDAVRNASLYVGNSQESVFANELVAAGIDLPPGGALTVAAPGGGAWGQMVMLYAGNEEEGELSLARVRVWAAEGDAAAGKPLFSGAGPPPPALERAVEAGGADGGAPGGGPAAAVAVAAGAGACVAAAAAAGAPGPAWLAVDLGYTADVASVVLRAEGAPAEGWAARVYVADAADPAEMVDSNACEAPATAGPGDAVAAATCARPGRFVLAAADAAGGAPLCLTDLEVYIDGPAGAGAAPTVATTSDVVAIAVGCALAGAALALAAAALAVYRRRRARVRAAGGSGDGSSDLEGGPKSGNGSPLAPRAGSATKALAAETDLSRFPGCDAVDFADLELLRPVGEGSYGRVYQARLLQTVVAVKLLGGAAAADGAVAEAAVASLVKEAALLATLRHPNIVAYLGYTRAPVGLIMDYCSRRSLDILLADGLAARDAAAAASLPGSGGSAGSAGSAPGGLNWVRLVSMAADAARGMLYLHTRSPPIVHRDLKSPNLLVDANWHVKISDFGLAKAHLDAAPGGAKSSLLAVTNPRWLAPEVLAGGRATAASDVFSFGVVLWELLAWELPWPRENPYRIIALVTGGARPPVPAADDLHAGPLACYAEYAALMARCWAQEPEARPEMGEVATLLRAMLSALVAAAIEAQASRRALTPDKQSS